VTYSAIASTLALNDNPPQTFPSFSLCEPTMKLLSFVAVAASLFVSSALAAEPLVLNVWPDGKVPGEPSGIGAEKDEGSPPNQKQVRRIGNVTHPTLTVFPAAKDKNTGAAVLIAPGGGYNILAWDLEGTEVAEWLNSIGVTGIVLKYRVPRRPGKDKEKVEPIESLQDAQRAMSLVRSRAGEWGIDPKKIGMLGFSAGGHLTAKTSTNFAKRSYDTMDAVDTQSCRPDFTVLIYPAYLIEKGASALRDELPISKETPPAFLAHATDDGVTPESSVFYYLALKRANVPAELHIYSTGGHGFGLRKEKSPSHTWPARCEEWLRAGDWIK
jgi:acetyl esterase/lipase